MVLIMGAILGFISIAFGAYVDHGLAQQVTPEVLHSVMTALRYHQLYAVLVVVLGIALQQGSKLASICAFRWSAYGFILGTLLFSFSIYLAALLQMPGLTILTPFGGITLILSWLLLVGAGVKEVLRLTRC